MSVKQYPVPASLSNDTHFGESDYLAMYQASLDDPTAFWASQIEELDWIKTPTIIQKRG